jgi:hypothetical protein
VAEPPTVTLQLLAGDSGWTSANSSTVHAPTFRVGVTFSAPVLGFDGSAVQSTGTLVRAVGPAEELAEGVFVVTMTVQSGPRGAGPLSLRIPDGAGSISPLNAASNTLDILYGPCQARAV